MSISSQQLIYYFKDEINKARRNPHELMLHLRNRIYLNNNEFAHSVIPNVHYKTREGPQAVQQALAYLSAKPPTKQLILSQDLCQAAFQVGQQLSKYPIVENPQQYLTRVDFQLSKTGAKNTGETQMIIQYGFRKDPEVVPMIVVSDGDPTRYNRNLILGDRAKYIGISVHEHIHYDYMIVILVNETMQPRFRCRCAIF